MITALFASCVRGECVRAQKNPVRRKCGVSPPWPGMVVSLFRVGYLSFSLLVCLTRGSVSQEELTYHVLADADWRYRAEGRWRVAIVAAGAALLSNRSGDTSCVLATKLHLHCRAPCLAHAGRCFALR